MKNETQVVVIGGGIVGVAVLYHLTKLGWRDATTADASGFEPVYRGDDHVGYITSGGYGHRIGESLALAYLDVGAIEAGVEYSVPLVGERHTAQLVTEIPFDPSGSKMRA